MTYNEIFGICSNCDGMVPLIEFAIDPLSTSQVVHAPPLAASLCAQSVSTFKSGFRHTDHIVDGSAYSQGTKSIVSQSYSSLSWGIGTSGRGFGYTDQIAALASPVRM